MAAHSYLNDTRYSNTENIEEYIRNINCGKYEKNIIIYEKQTNKEKQKEYMLLGLRTIKGISIDEFKNKYTENPLFLFNKELEKLVKEELLAIDGNYIKLTDKGLDLANIVWEEFV